MINLPEVEAKIHEAVSTRNLALEFPVFIVEFVIVYFYQPIT